MSVRFSRSVFWAALGGALLALAGHLELLRRFGTVLPYRDQWRLTAVDLLSPYYRGELGLRQFFEPLNDHWPVLTRLLSFGLIQLNGQWNNFVETSLNSLLFAASLLLFLVRVLPAALGWWRPLLAVVAGVVFALPITWENTLWGIQSLVYLQIALTIVYLGAISSARTFSWMWWVGHLAGVAVLLTQHSGVLAHVAAALLLAWRWWKSDGDRRVNVAGFGFAVAAILLFVVFFPSITTTAALRADSWEIALDVMLRQLAWPMPHPACAFLMYLPWLAWTVDRVGARSLNASDAFILACGLWVGGQAAAIGYGRAVDTHTFASRYCDFLALGFVLNAACVARLWAVFPHRAVRICIGLFAVIWCAAPVQGFWWESTESHARYNLERRPGENTRNLARIKNYFVTKDASALLNDSGTQAELYTYAPALPPLLDEPRFQAILPPETGSPLARKDDGRLGWLPNLIIPRALLFAALGTVLVGLSAWYVWKERADPRVPVSPGLTWSWPRAAGASVLLFVLALGGWRAWRNGEQFDETQRLNAAFAPLAEGITFADLEFIRHDGNMHGIMPARSSVETLPPAARLFWYGTRMKMTPDFQGVLKSQAFPVAGRFLVVPFTGYPCFPGNGLRVRFFNAKTNTETYVSYVGPDPAVDWNIWTIDTTAHAGEDASIYMYDGNAGATGWLGVARPAQTDDPALSARWRSILRIERGEKTHRTLVWATFVNAAFAAVTLGIVYWQRRRSRPLQTR